MPKILVVDDEPHIREVVRPFLTPEGYDVIEAGDGDAALEIALKEPSVRRPRNAFDRLMHTWIQSCSTCRLALLFWMDRSLYIPK